MAELVMIQRVLQARQKRQKLLYQVWYLNL